METKLTGKQGAEGTGMGRRGGRRRGRY